MLFRNSRYALATPELVDGLLILNDREPIAFIEDTSNRVHVVQEGDDWSSIAARFFGNLDIASPELLYWAIMEFQPSPSSDPTIPPEPGSIVIIPSERIMADVILSRRPKGT